MVMIVECDGTEDDDIANSLFNWINPYILFTATI